MDTNKNNTGGKGGWILCQSKSFPGKLYYFNVRSGEAVWSLNTNEKIMPKIDSKFNIQRSIHKVHSYPEPTSPPMYSPVDTPANFFSNDWSDNSMISQSRTFQNLSVFGQQIPIFSQQALNPNFQNCMSMNNMIWIPIQLPFWPYFCPGNSRTPAIQKTPQSLQRDKEISVHTSGIPLTQRFVNYEATSIKFNKENKIINENVPSASQTNSNSRMDPSQNHINEYIPESVSNMECESAKNKFKSIATQTVSDKLDSYPDMPIPNDKGNLHMNLWEKGANTEDTNVGQEPKKKIIINSDLRLLLLSKRRGFQAEDIQEAIEKKKVKLQHVIQPAPKKKMVTFHLENVQSNNCEPYVPKSPPLRKIDPHNLEPMLTAITFHNNSASVDQTQKVFDTANHDTTGMNKNNTDTNISKNTQTNENNSKYNGAIENAVCNVKIDRDMHLSDAVFTSYKDVWYLVVDMDVLLDNKMLIDNLMQADEKCRLLIPQALRHEIDLLCIGDYGGQQRVLVARQLSRKMAAMDKQIIVESPPSENVVHLNTTDHILKCCVNAKRDHYYVVLISNDANLKTRANELQIPCYTAQEVKNGALVQPKLFSDFKKIKLTIDNTRTHESNSFTQNKLSNLFSNKNNTYSIDSNARFNILYNITKPKSKIDNNNSKEDQPTNISEDTTQHNVLQPTELHNGQTIDNTVQNYEENIPISNTRKYKTLNFFESEGPGMVHSDIITSKENNSPSNEENNLHDIQKIDHIENYTSKENNTQLSNKNTNANLNSPKNYTPNEISKSKYKIPKLNQNNKITAISSDLENVSDSTDHIRSNFKNTAVNLEGSLKKYCDMAKGLNHTIRKRMDEWICTYTQIMEEFLSNILQNKSSDMNMMNTSASKLLDSLNCVKMLYDNDDLKHIIELLVKLLSQCTCYKGKIKLDTEPQVLMKIIGCGVLLVDSLKTILPESAVLKDCESYLKALLENIESQNVDIELEWLRPEVVCRSEVVTNKETRYNYTKDRSYVLEYLKKHFKDWAEVDVTEHISHKNLKVVRMNGKDLKWVKIDKDKSVSYIQAINHLDDEDLAETVRLSDDHHHENNSPKKDKESALNIIQHIDNEQLPTHGHTFAKEDDVTGPKMIRNIKIIDKYENIRKNKEPLDKNNSNINSNADNTAKIKKYFVISDDPSEGIVDDDDSNKSIIISHNKISYKNNFHVRRDDNDIKNNTICEDKSVRNKKKKIKVNGNHRTNVVSKNGDLNNNNHNDNPKDDDKNNSRKDIFRKDDKKYGSNTMQLMHRDDSTIDSGFENESTQAHSLVKTFLNEFSCTFKLTYNFIANFTAEIRGQNMCQDKKNIHHSKANRCLAEMDAIIQQLKSIIHRESKEDTALRNLLLCAGTEAINDKRITRYRQIVIKCLEQAQILASALRIIVCITIGDLKAINFNSDISNSYINIFE